MPVTQIDLHLAVAEGIISNEQAEQLRHLAVRDVPPGETTLDFSQDPRDEPFRFIRGFRDVFIAIGLLIFVIGLTTIEIKLVVSALGEFFHFGSFPVGQAIFAVMLAVGLCVAGFFMAAFITDKHRLPLSSMVLATSFAAWTGIISWFITISILVEREDLAVYQDAFMMAEYVAAAQVGAAIGAAIFYWLFRFPFALLLMSLATVSLIFAGLNSVFSPDWMAQYESLVFGLLGLSIFAAAMWFDFQDRLRVTRLAECAFWLHLLAAPMLVHTVLGARGLEDMNIIPVGAVMVIISIIALLIDRRALLVSGLSYFAISIWQFVAAGIDAAYDQFILTTVILGGFVLILGLGWHPIRRKILGWLPGTALTSRLPPAPARPTT